MSKTVQIIIGIFIIFPSMVGQEGQIPIPRIEMMPNEPSPYNVRDWKQVAIQYNDFIYDLQKTGQYLPLSYLVPSGTNYPDKPGFGLHTYVGTYSPLGNEAINVLPSLVGATLVGIDKTQDKGYNWIEMSRDFFNRNNGEWIYLNNLSGKSGGDWWYDIMPNVFFYQLYDLYPNQGEEVEFQLRSVANQFTRSVMALGGSDTPWEKAFFDYRAFDFLTMTPNPSGVKQPEAAGAYAWVLYSAYKQTGDPKYLKAAEWSLEFLSDWTSNPSYELQLPYGTYTAAKMNAELNTTYDIEKMLNWSFDRGHLRGWGTIVGRWGGFDVSGLVGEANDNGNDYAFQLNGVQQAAALAPMVRYDKRFARAIGKWILNLANATRLFYPGFLPSFLQDASEWSDSHDPDRIMGYEALREQWEGNSPFSTGDAVRGNWAATNLALYGSSSIGYLGAILQPTDVPKIIGIDLLKTDFFQEEAYTSHLYFNPHNTSQNITIDLGDEPIDLYNTLTEEFVVNNATGLTVITLPPDEAMVLVHVPAGADIEYDQNKTLANGIPIDYSQSKVPYNYAPRIQALATTSDVVQFEDSIRLFIAISDRDSDQFEYEWSVSGGEILEAEGLWFWKAPSEEKEYEIKLKVTDDTGLQDSTILKLNAVVKINNPPQIESIVASDKYVSPGESIILECIASDPDGDPLTYDWSVSGGQIDGEGAIVNWTAPLTNGIYQIQVRVTDIDNAWNEAEISLLVKDFESVPGGKILAHYPMEGNAMDISGNELHGVPSGAFLVSDRLSSPASAYRFNGNNHHILVNHSEILNVEDAITVSSWFSPQSLPDRESFLLSHGSWQNRWKVSITPERLIRWTLHFSNGMIRDLDTKIPIDVQSYYHVVATYDGTLMALYINGELDNFIEVTGKIKKTNIPMMMAQMLPGATEYNFAGIIDEVILFDYALRPDAVDNLYNGIISHSQNSINHTGNIHIYPNPFSDHIRIQFQYPLQSDATIKIVDTSGKPIFHQKIKAGNDSYQLNTEMLHGGVFAVILQQGDSMIYNKIIKF